MLIPYIHMTGSSKPFGIVRDFSNLVQFPTLLQNSLKYHQVIDAGDAVRAELREHEQALLEEEEVEREAADQAKLQVRVRVLVRFPQIHLSSAQYIVRVRSTPCSIAKVWGSHVGISPPTSQQL